MCFKKNVIINFILEQLISGTDYIFYIERDCLLLATNLIFLHITAKRFLMISKLQKQNISLDSDKKSEITDIAHALEYDLKIPIPLIQIFFTVSSTSL